MKKLYTLIILLGCAVTINAQSKTWVGPTGGYWSNEDNWFPEGVPYSNNNVLIPTGSYVNVDAQESYPFMDTLTVESGATVNKYESSNMTMNRGYFEAGSVLNMYEGKLVSEGIVIDGELNTFGALSKGFTYGLIEMNNTFTIEPGSGPFILRDNTMVLSSTAVLNIPGDGIMDISAFSATLENHGLIQKFGGTGDFIIDINFEDIGGTINVTSGNLLFQENADFTNSTINVDAGSSIAVWESSKLSGTLTGLLDGPLEFSGLVGTPTDETVILDFAGNAQVELSGTLHLGDFINEGLFTFSAMAPDYNGFSNCTFINNGAIDMAGDGSLNTSQNAFLHNTATGSINLLNSNTISGGFGSSILNEGLLTNTANANNALITTNFTNDGGTISVLGDTLAINYSTLGSGQYDVDTGAALYLGGGTDFNGTLTGQLDGPMMLRWGGSNFSDSDTTVFNFTGAAQVDWYNGSFGGGVFKNMSTINAISIEVYANQLTLDQFINEGQINVNGVHGIFVSSSASLLNTATGVIDIQNDNSINCGGGVHNFGLIKKSGGTDVSPITGQFFHDYPGLVHIEEGTLSFSNMQPGNGDFAGAGTLSIGNNYIVEGDVSPGNSPGILSIAGDYTSSPTAMLNIELNGNNAGIDFDVLAVGDAAILKGGINLTMAYAPEANEQFEIITAMSIDSCLLPATVTAEFGGEVYTYDVICNTDNVTLGLLSVGLDDLSSEHLISVYPNPMSQLAKVNLSETQNRTNSARLMITNSLGQTLRSIQVSPTATSIDLERGDLPSGLYNIQLVDESQLKSGFKLLIE